MGTDLSGIDFFFLTVPVLFVLLTWIGMILWADAHPRVRHVGGVSGRAVGASGGRAGMPGQGGPPAESALATGAADEDTGQAAAGGQQAPAPQGAPAPAEAAPGQTMPDRREPDDTAPDHPAV